MEERRQDSQRLDPKKQQITPNTYQLAKICDHAPRTEEAISRIKVTAHSLQFSTSSFRLL